MTHPTVLLLLTTAVVVADSEPEGDPAPWWLHLLAMAGAIGICALVIIALNWLKGRLFGRPEQ
ncbi:hypothetical protein [Nesterenkonia alba]|uniref:hypothetical protein n=1 Tax=Nesterenkonia alba TaxID=515814 RepID=UPI0003B788BD|nr:hypothetical protein [Nesterenkonia alba]